MNYFKFFIVLLLFVNTVNSQEKRTIQIIQAGKSIRSSAEYPGANILQKDGDLRVFYSMTEQKLNLIYLIITLMKIHSKLMGKLFLIKETLYF